jgi:hypothetical protein
MGTPTRLGAHFFGFRAIPEIDNTSPDNACGLDKRGAREVIAGKPAPAECVSFGVGMTWRVVWQKALIIVTW